MGKEMDQTNTMYEARTENMVSHKDGKLTLRAGKFLKPCAKSIKQALQVPNTPLLSDFISHNIQLWPPERKVLFKDWKTPQKNWKQWVDKLSVKYGALWEKTGICDGIMSSIYEVRCHHDLIVGLLEFWCSETNTFVYPWGEASITLEDVMILGGLPVLGESVTVPLSWDLGKIEEELNRERLEIGRGKSRKASHSEWLRRFMEKESELEHVAFLSLWLSRYVFPCLTEKTIDKRVFPIAIRLSQGTQIALAPAILASLYKNLRLLKDKVISSLKSVVVSGPFRLMQVWGFEHFPLLGPSLPNTLQPGEPRVARWHNLSCKITLPLVRSVLRLAENFIWRPYASNLKNWRHLAYYKEAEQVLHDYLSLDVELQSFVQCLFGCELLGIDCKEKYMPQRVAMQFGFDQDLPCDNSGTDFMSKNCVLFFPTRAFEPGISAKYFHWWNESKVGRQDAINNLMVGDRSLKSSTVSPLLSFASRNLNKFENSGQVSIGFIRKQNNDSNSPKFDVRIMGKCLSKGGTPPIFKSERCAANGTTVKMNEDNSHTSVASKNMKGVWKKPQVSTESKHEKFDARMTPVSPLHSLASRNLNKFENSGQVSIGSIRKQRNAANSPKFEIRIMGKCLSKGGPPPIFKSKRCAANGTTVKMNEDNCHASVASKSMKDASKKSQVQTEFKREKINGMITPESPSNAKKAKIEYSSDDDYIPLSMRLQKHALSVNGIHPHKADATGNNARKGEMTATQGKFVASDSKVKKKNGYSVDDPIQPTNVVKDIAWGKASRGSVSVKTNQGDSKKVGDHSNRSVDLVAYVGTTSRSTIQQPPKLYLEERLAKVEKMLGVIPL